MGREDGPVPGKAKNQRGWKGKNPTKPESINSLEFKKKGVYPPHELNWERDQQVEGNVRGDRCHRLKNGSTPGRPVRDRRQVARPKKGFRGTRFKKKTGEGGKKKYRTRKKGLPERFPCHCRARPGTHLENKAYRWHNNVPLIYQLPFRRSLESQGPASEGGGKGTVVVVERFGKTRNLQPAP